MIDSRGISARDWLVFFALVLVPSSALATLGFRAVANEDAAVRRETSGALEVTASRVPQALELGLSRGAESLATMPASEDAQMYEGLRAIAPAFADPFVLSPIAEVLVPKERQAAAPAADARCDALARELPQAADRASVIGQIVASCEDVRTASGRYLWPMLAIEAPSVPDARVASWLSSHAPILAPAERAATLASVRATRGEHLASLLASPGAEATLSLLRGGLASSLCRASPDARKMARYEEPGVVAVVRELSDGRRVGFVAHIGTLAAGAWNVPEGQVIAFAPAARARQGDALEASVMMGPGLVAVVSVADRQDLARRTSRARAWLFVATGVAVLVAVSLSALLFRKMQSARRLGELRTDFIAAVSHELRTPAASVRMLAELLERGMVDEGERPEIFAALSGESRRLGDTVERMLGFARMTRGKLRIERGSLSVGAIANASVDASPARAKVERRIDDVMADVDGAQLRVAIDNLLTNAAKYAPEGTPYVVTVRAEEGCVIVEVKDHGPGIDEAHHERIFEPFQRADDRLSRATEGTGIGLSLVRGVARAHGGDVTLVSAPGRGATFRVRLPREIKKHA